MSKLESGSLIKKDSSIKKTKKKKEVLSPELQQLLESPDFEDFVMTIEESLDDDFTFNTALSSNIVLQKALKILRQWRDKEKE